MRFNVRSCGMNKAELTEELATRLSVTEVVATDFVEALVDTIVRAVVAGDSITITGFGVFESTERAARTARNPKTGASVAVPARSIPKFRPAPQFRAVVSGVRELGDRGRAVGRAAVGPAVGRSPVRAIVVRRDGRT